MEDKSLVVSKGIEVGPDTDIQVNTGKKYPRNVKECLAEAISIATMDEETAGSTWYVLPRKKEDGTYVQGPTVRAAEMLAYSWTNLRAESFIEEIGSTHITAVGVVFDTERNMAYRHHVKRRITRKDGTRYNDDGITNACNAACSIAFREAVFKAIPRAFVNKVCEAARIVANGNATNLAEKRGKAFEYFAKLGVTKEVLLERLGKATIEDVTVEDVGLLRDWSNAIKEGGSVDDYFGPQQSAGSALTEKLKKPKLDQGGVHQAVKEA